MINRTQVLVLAFFVLAVLGLLVLAAVDPEIYQAALRVPAIGGFAPGFVFVAVLACFLGVLGVGVIRRWRWTFWLIAAAFLAGGLRIPGTALQLAGILPSTGPDWYEILQAAIGVVQVAIGLLMLSGYRRFGAWGRF